METFCTAWPGSVEDRNCSESDAICKDAPRAFTCIRVLHNAAISLTYKMVKNQIFLYLMPEFCLNPPHSVQLTESQWIQLDFLSSCCLPLSLSFNGSMSFMLSQSSKKLLWTQLIQISFPLQFHKNYKKQAKKPTKNYPKKTQPNNKKPTQPTKKKKKKREVSLGTIQLLPKKLEFLLLYLELPTQHCIYDS